MTAFNIAAENRTSQSPHIALDAVALQVDYLETKLTAVTDEYVEDPNGD